MGRVAGGGCLGVIRRKLIRSIWVSKSAEADCHGNDRDSLICGLEQTSKDKCGRQFVQTRNVVLQNLVSDTDVTSTYLQRQPSAITRRLPTSASAQASNVSSGSSNCYCIPSKLPI